MIKRPCKKPGCSTLTTGGYCDEHRNHAKVEADKRRGTATERGYNWRWQKARKIKLRENPLCERCKRVAVLVHHVDRDPLNNQRENLEALCRECHDQEHESERWRCSHVETGVDGGGGRNL